MTDLADVKEPNDGSFDEVVDILHRVLSFFSDLELSLPYLTEFIGKYAVFLYMLVAILNRIKEHHWKLRKWTNSIPSTLVSNTTPESVIWVKLYYSEEPLPEDLQGYPGSRSFSIVTQTVPEMRTLISEEFTRVEPGELVKLLVSQHCLTVYATVFVKNPEASKARPIAILHPLNLWQSLMVTNKETISLMSDASPCSDYERLPSEAERTKNNKIPQ
uniref:PEX-1N domain-containing protein n=1 Tax=Steinernema glaseri TaxID=37863 RepID=A0A1I7YDG1_9BILA